jgi:HEAT repeat protein
VKPPLLFLGALTLALQGSADCPAVAQPAAARRSALLEHAREGAKAIPALAAALQDANLVVRRTAVRLLSEAGPPAHPALTDALANSDMLVRHTALLALCNPLTLESLPPLETATNDKMSSQARSRECLSPFAGPAG